MKDLFAGFMIFTLCLPLIIMCLYPACEMINSMIREFRKENK